MNPILAAAASVLAATTAIAQDWPAFRGPAGDGVAQVKSASLRWSREHNVCWKLAMPRSGNGSAIVANGRVFATSALDAEGKRRSLLCFDRRDGRELWRRTAVIDKVMPTHKTNPYCETTPVADGERVIVWRRTAGLTCYDFAGEALWTRDLGEFRHPWGYSTSPLLHDGLVLLNAGAGKRCLVIAVRLSDGKTFWQDEEPQADGGRPKKNPTYVGTWCTPVLARTGEGEASRHRSICTLPTRVVAFDPVSGEIVWSCDGVRNTRGDLAHSSPVVSGDFVTVVGGWDGPGIGIRLGGEGEVTKSHRAWRFPTFFNCIGTGVFVDGSIYWPNSGGSIVHAAGRLYSTDQAGTTLVLAPNAEKLEVLAKNELGETCNATPAFSDGEIFIRTHAHLYCISDAKTADSSASTQPSKPRRVRR